jgi:uracil-DNA glycosylase
LPEQQLASILQRDTPITHLGNRDAQVLAIFETPAQSAAGLPLENSDSQLFDAMLQAIGLARRDVCLCVLTAVAGSATTTVSDLDLTQRRAMLLFVAELDTAEDERLHRFTASVHGTPGWRLPHPALLLREPLRKRQAWNVLKAVRAAVAGG